MMAFQAKKLKPGDEVLLRSDTGTVIDKGVVTYKRYNILRIKWNDFEYHKEYDVYGMTSILTQAQLDAEAEGLRVIASVKAWNEEKLKQPIQKGPR